MAKTKTISQNKKFEIDIARSHTVVKANELIQKSRFELSSQEQKVILCLISKIKPNDKEFQEYEFEINEFCKLCGIETNNGKNYKNIKDTIKKLSDKSLWITLDAGTEVLLRWVNTAKIDKRSGVIKLGLHEIMKPYLLELKARFTQYELINTLTMRSQYSIRLYELLKSHEYKGKWLVEIDKLKRLLSAENYKLYANFKQKVLGIAMREINDLSDIDVEYEALKVGRKFTEIEFKIKPKGSEGSMAAWLERTKRLNANKMR